MPTETQRIINLLGVGSYTDFIAELVLAAGELNADHVLLAVGGAEFNRATTSERPPLAIPGVVDISPAVIDQRHSFGFLGDEQRVDAARDSWEAATHALIDRLITVEQAANLRDALTIWMQSASSGHTTIGEEVLSDLHQRRPYDLLLAMTVLPDESYLRAAVADDPDRFVRLHDAGVIEATLLTDNRSPLALSEGLTQQGRYLARGLATLFAAIAHFPNQRSIADVVHAFQRISPWFGVACASANVTAAKPVRWWGPLRNGLGLPQRARGSLDDLVIAVRTTTEATLSDPTRQLIAEPIDLNRQAFLALTIPLKRQDPRWLELAPLVKEWLAREYPTVTPLFSSGNGVADRRFEAPYWVQASLFFPLQARPQAIQEIINAQQGQAASSSTSTNNYRPAQDLATDISSAAVNANQNGERS